LKDNRPAPDHRLPDTGVGYEKEKLLSPLFITSPDYGTRCSTVLIVHRNGRIEVTEVTWQPGRAAPVPDKKRYFTYAMEDARNHC
jgi:uncharacterized protein with NRDE domain